MLLISATTSAKKETLKVKRQYRCCGIQNKQDKTTGRKRNEAHHDQVTESGPQVLPNFRPQSAWKPVIPVRVANFAYVQQVRYMYALMRSIYDSMKNAAPRECFSTRLTDCIYGGVFSVDTIHQNWTCLTEFLGQPSCVRNKRRNVPVVSSKRYIFSVVLFFPVFSPLNTRHRPAVVCTTSSLFETPPHSRKKKRMSRSSGSSVSLYLRKRNVERDDGSVISLPYQKLSSKSSLQIATSCISDITSSPIRRKTTSRLGRPPGEEIPVASSTRQPIKSSSSTPISSVKTAPMKELQKVKTNSSVTHDFFLHWRVLAFQIITDLKKENFDLKLRLFHLEEMRADVQQEVNYLF